MHTRVGKPNLVSIVLPVYNGAGFLHRSIESCLGQSYRDIELIVVDDGSEDNSVDIVQSYDDHRLKLVRHELNRKLPAALNTGFEHALGIYLTWTSHDNYYAPNAIAEMVSFLEEHPQVHFVFADYYMVNQIGQILQQIETGPVQQLVERSCIGPCFLYRRIVYEKVGPYNERAFLAEDYEYWLRASACFTFAHLGRALYYYGLHPDSLTSRYGGGEVTEAALAAKRQILGRNLWRNRMLLHRTHLSAAFRLYQRNRRAAAARAILWGIAFDPRCLGDRRVQALLAALYLGQKGLRLLQQAKHAIRRIATRGCLPTQRSIVRERDRD
jgi:glycosyltransferase involved in cell wall biosynthesis